MVDSRAGELYKYALTLKRRDELSANFLFLFSLSIYLFLSFSLPPPPFSIYLPYYL